jgi:hypothetical protein
MERKRIRTTLWSEDNPPLPDLVNQDFAPGEPDVAWCGDIERHEALVNREEVEDLLLQSVAAG